jgi:hypothetical protein
MNEYEFTLKFSLKDTSSHPEIYIDKLWVEGCDDALVGIGKNGRIALDFTRESSSAQDAVISALEDVKRAIPKAKLIEATPDFVGLTDIANFVGLTHQNLNELMISSGSAFPTPVHEGKSSDIWHLFNVLVWLKEQNNYPIEETLIDIAKANMRFNIAKEAYKIEPFFQQNIRALMT